jgi:secondary thiamine-phosphate synthase enzyme
MEKFLVTTKQKRAVVDITSDVEDLLREINAENGLCHLFVGHTTAALTTADLDPGTDLDMLDAFDAMVPKLEYRHEHNPEHVPDHILSSIIGSSVTIPVRDGLFSLGRWQRIVMIEFNGPENRDVYMSFVPESDGETSI